MQNLFRRARSGSSRTGDARRLSPHLWFGLLLIPIVTGVLLGAGTAGAASSDYTYNCGNGGLSACYNQIQWNGDTTGVQTSISTNQITTKNCFIKNTVLLADDKGWVEAGIISDPTHNSGADTLYWAATGLDGKFKPQFGPPLAKGDFGKFVKVEITANPNDTITVDFRIDSDQSQSQSIVQSQSQSIVQSQGQSIVQSQSQSIVQSQGQSHVYITAKIAAPNKPFKPDMITIGMQLCGTSGASAPWNSFTNNQYRDLKDGKWYPQFEADPKDNGNANGSHNHGNAAGGNTNPVNGKWFSKPAKGSDTGGDFRTCIVGSHGCS